MVKRVESKPVLFHHLLPGMGQEKVQETKAVISDQQRRSKNRENLHLDPIKINKRLLST